MRSRRVIALAFAGVVAVSLPPGARADEAANEPQGKAVQADTHGRIYLSSLIHTELMNTKGDKVGEIDDILVDKKGSIQLLVMVGGFLGIGNRDVLVPWSKLDIMRTNRNNVIVSLPMTKAELKAIHEYER